MRAEHEYRNATLVTKSSKAGFGRLKMAAWLKKTSHLWEVHVSIYLFIRKYMKYLRCKYVKYSLKLYLNQSVKSILIAIVVSILI